jgi:hypothetical protein
VDAESPPDEGAPPAVEPTVGFVSGRNRPVAVSAAALARGRAVLLPRAAWRRQALLCATHCIPVSLVSMAGKSIRNVKTGRDVR